MSCLTLDQGQVSALIPHRAPFLFVTSASIESPSKIHAVAQWDAGNPIFDGHFPSFPVVPGVLMVEAAAQIAGVLISSNGAQALRQEGAADAAAQQHLGVLIGVKRAAFHKPVLPGDRLHFTVVLENQVGGMVTAVAQAIDDDGKRVFKGEVSVAVVAKDVLMGRMKAADPA